MSFDTSMAALLPKEGGYTDNPKDPGGETKFGITEIEARSHGYTGKMIDLPLDIATQIYKQNYWDALSLDQIDNEALQDYLFDMGVNIGVTRAARIFQRALNAFRVRGDVELYPVLIVDGKIGPTTLSAYQFYMSIRDPKVLLKAVSALRGHYYISISEANNALLAFTYGWVKNRIL